MTDHDPYAAAFPDDMTFDVLPANAVVLSEQLPQKEKVLTPEQRAIARGSYIRLFGRDKNGEPAGREQEYKDIDTIVAINNALVINGDKIVEGIPGPDKDLSHIRESLALKKYSSDGFQINEFTRSIICKLLFEDGGYAFFVEYADDTGTTPYGSQIGFPFIPREGYPSLGKESLPMNTSMFRHSLDSTLQIWRSTILKRIERVREAFDQLGIHICTALEGQVLQSNGAGLATKLVDGVAGMELEKTMVQCNIADLARPRHLEDIVTADQVMARNEKSRGANKQVFRETKFTRSHSNFVYDSRGRELLEALWRIFMNTPQDIVRLATGVDVAAFHGDWEAFIEAAEAQQSRLVQNGWPIRQVIRSGVRLAKAIRSTGRSNVVSQAEQKEGA